MRDARLSARTHDRVGDAIGLALVRITRRTETELGLKQAAGRVVAESLEASLSTLARTHWFRRTRCNTLV